MPDEPERDIEKTLKAYAERRRQQAGAPLELHPATRRMLQAEAARQRATKAEQRGFWSELAGLLKRRMVFVSALGVVVVAIALPLIPALNRGKQQQAAYLSRSLEGASRKEPIATAPSEELAKAKPSDDLFRDKKATSNGVVLSAPIAPAVVLNEAEASFAKEKQKGASNFALDDTITKSVANPSVGGDSSKVPAIAQNAAAVPPNSSQAARAGESSPAQATALGLATATETGRVASPASPPPNNSPGFAGPPAETLQQNYQATNPVLAFKNEPAPNRFRADGVRPSPAAASAPSPMLAAQAPAVSTPPSGAITASEFAMSDSIPNGSATQRFYRLAESTRKTTAKASRNRGVLDSFRVEQSGGTMRVIDGDGSVYLGFVQPSDQAVQHLEDSRASASVDGESAQPASKALPDRSMETLSGGAPAAQSFFFRVTGTNRTLRQSIVFSGTLTPTTQITGVHTGSQARAVGGILPAAKAAGPGALPLSRSQLRGRALIGGTNAVDVSASPSPR